MTKSNKPDIPQMSDIAELAGVSKSTVSRALADSPLVNEKTKNLVKRIADEQNYRLNTTASNFRKKTHLTIAVLMPAAKDASWRLSDPFFLELLGAIAEAVDVHGHQLLLTRTEPQDGDWIENFIRKRYADGVILIGQGSQHEAINQLAATYKAISVWGTQVSPDQHYPVVGSDNRLGGYRACQYLLQQGRRDIAFVGHDHMPETIARFNGYQQALDEFKIALRDELIPDTTKQESFLAVSQMLETNIHFDAIVATSDLHAIACIRAIQAAGKRVPEDIAVVGYDDIPLAAYYNPPITTIHQNLSMGAKILVDNLLEAIDGKKPEVINLNPELIIRGSA